MATVIPEFAEAMAQSQKRAAASVGEEIRQAEFLRARVPDTSAELNRLRRHLLREARAARRDAVASSGDLRELWDATITALRSLAADEQIRAIKAILHAVAAGRQRLEAVRRLWALVVEYGGVEEGVDQLAAVEQSYAHMDHEGSRALGARMTTWQPSDAARLEQGLKEIADGKAVGPDEARSRFQRNVAG